MSPRAHANRDLKPFIAQVALIGRDTPVRDRMLRLVDAAWDHFGDDQPPHIPGRGVSWIGFYMPAPASHATAAGEEQLTLGPRRNKPACSPIGMHGACGRCFRSRSTLIVRDVAHLGAGYIACDPRDRSELVLPCIDASGSCVGVLDIDSFDVDAFDRRDADAFAHALALIGLGAGAHPPVQVIDGAAEGTAPRDRS